MIKVPQDLVIYLDSFRSSGGGQPSREHLPQRSPPTSCSFATMLALLIHATPSLLLPPLAPLRAPSARVAIVRMDDLTSGESVLDSTPKFDKLAAGAALDGSAAASLGREPGTCDPYDPKSADFCMEEPDDSKGGMQR